MVKSTIYDPKAKIKLFEIQNFQKEVGTEQQKIIKMSIKRRLHSKAVPEEVPSLYDCGCPWP